MTLVFRKNGAKRYVIYSQGGVALAILIWFVAAMSILVAGIVLQARVDIKLAQFHATRARVEAAADGAIQLALADLMRSEVEGEYFGRGVSHGSYKLGDIEVSVSLTPLTGLVDLNMAAEGLLYMLFSAIDGIDENAANELSSNVVKWRSGAGQVDPVEGEFFREQTPNSVDATGAYKGRFQAIEDLLLVQGVDRRIFEAVQHSVYVDQAGQAGVDWVSAPVPVLRALGVVDEEIVMALAEARLTERVEDLVVPEGLDLSFQEVATLSSYRADAMVMLEDTVFLRRRWVSRGGSGVDGLPWRFFRTEAVDVIGRSQRNELTTVGRL